MVAQISERCDGSKLGSWPVSGVADVDDLVEAPEEAERKETPAQVEPGSDSIVPPDVAPGDAGQPPRCLSGSAPPQLSRTL
jgi:hypothetical protein